MFDYQAAVTENEYHVATKKATMKTANSGMDFLVLYTRQQRAPNTQKLLFWQ